MATAVASQVSDKVLCAGGCGNSYTQATLNNNGGICGRCAKKRADSQPQPALQVPSLQAPQVFPNSSIAAQLVLPNIANLSLSSDGKTLPVQTLTFAARLDAWAKKANPNNIKEVAAVAAVVTEAGTAADHKRMDAIPNIHMLNLEKKWDAIKNLYLQ